MSNGVPSSMHTKFIVGSVLILGVLCILVGGVLTWRGYDAQLLIGGGISAISGLLGVLSTKQQPPPDVTISSPPPKVEVSQPVT